MDQRSVGLIYCAKKLGYLKEDQIRLISRENIPVEDFLHNNKYSAWQLQNLKLFFIERCLLMVLGHKQYLSKELFSRLKKQQVAAFKKNTPTSQHNSKLLQIVAKETLEEIAARLYIKEVYHSEEYDLLVSILTRENFNDSNEGDSIYGESTDLEPGKIEVESIDPYAETMFDVDEGTDDEFDPFAKTIDGADDIEELGNKNYLTNQAKLLDPLRSKANISHIGNFFIVRQIGKGRLGEIFLGEDKNNNTQVAIRLIPQNNKNIHSDFTNSTQLYSSFHHPSIAQILEYGHNSKLNCYYIVAKYINGLSLQQFIKRRGTLSAKNTLKIAIIIAKALESALNHKLIHSGLNPGNIMLEKTSGTIKLLDFGIAKIIDNTRLTPHRETPGSIYYMAPEQIQDAKKVTYQTDIYALGSTIYYMLAGVPPYNEHTKLNEILNYKLSFHPRSLNEYIKISPKVIEFIEKTMAYKPQDRYQTFASMIQDMKLLFAQET